MNILTISHLSKSFGELRVLRDISCTVQKGEVVSIIGPSGSGKSTLLRCAALLETPDAGVLSYGDIHVFGPQAGGKEAFRRAREKFGMVFQNFNLFPHFSVLKNLMDAPVRVQKRPVDEVRQEALERLKNLGLERRENAYPCQLSGGQQQRVAIGRALMMKPEILFFDEPTSALDPELTKEVLRIIRQLAEVHMTMVIVTHEIAFARNVSDRVIFMADGRVVEEGPAVQVIDSPREERTRAFLAGMNEDI